MSILTYRRGGGALRLTMLRAVYRPPMAASQLNGRHSLSSHAARSSLGSRRWRRGRGMASPKLHSKRCETPRTRQSRKARIYDDNGNQPLGRSHFATLSPHFAITNHDFILVS